MAQQLFDINLRAALFAIALTFSTARAQTLTVLHTFTGVPDGREPVAGLTMDAAGNLYGTTYYGGTHESGLVYKLARQGAGWILRPLYSFTGGDDGAQPIGGVTIGSDGSLYGTTSVGGQHSAGVVYKLSPPATICKSFACPWTETPLYQFTGGVDGGNPDAAPIFDSTGNLYGTAGTGGTGNNGVIYRLKPAQNGWIDSVLYSFTGKPDSSGPFSGLTFDGNGNLYGTTLFGGSGYGTVYQLTPSGSAWTEKVIYAFQGLNDGSTPYAGLVVDPDGNLYGSSFYFGSRQRRKHLRAVALERQLDLHHTLQPRRARRRRGRHARAHFQRYPLRHALLRQQRKLLGVWMRQCVPVITLQRPVGIHLPLRIH